MKVKCDKDGIEVASKVINDGGVIIFPTDTVYGIGCNPYDKDAVKRIYHIKRRDVRKPFPILGYSKEELSKIARFTKSAEIISEKYWPGPLTMVLELSDKKLKSILGLGDKVAVRVPNNLCTLEILKKCKLLVGTSANYSGHGSFTDPSRCELTDKDYDVLVDSGKIESQGESTIIGFDDDKIIIHRDGPISKLDLEKII